MKQYLVMENDNYEKHHKENINYTIKRQMKNTLSLAILLREDVNENLKNFN